MPNYQIQRIYPGAVTTSDFRNNRIKIKVNENNIVTDIPRIG